MIEIVIAKANTGNFEFIAVGATDTEALTNLRKGLTSHARVAAVREPASWVQATLNEANLYDVPVGATLRDGSVI